MKEQMKEQGNDEGINEGMDERKKQQQEAERHLNKQTNKVNKYMANHVYWERGELIASNYLRTSPLPRRKTNNKQNKKN